MPYPTIKLSDGTRIPGIGFGTGGIPKDQDVKAQVLAALETGFTHIDTAQTYGNEDQTGEALTAYGKRSSLYITTKFSGKKDSIIESAQDSLKFLQLDHVDLYLIHSPRFAQPDIKSAWKEMEEVHKRGWAKSIGVSNFSISDLKEVLSSCTIRPTVNQILLHPYVYKSTKELLEFCQKEDIVIEAYSPLVPLRESKGKTNGPVDKPVKEIADRLNVLPEQVLLAWAAEKKAVVLTKSSKKERLEGYLKAGDVKLTTEDVKAIDQAGAEWDEKK